MKVKLTPLNRVEVTREDGKYLGVFNEEETWHGFTLLKRLSDGAVLIVDEFGKVGSCSPLLREE